jgi:tetratricopeptide (TPR) repeat protein
LPGLVTLRNGIIGGDPVFIASQGGINFYLGNRPGADGFNPSTPWRYRFDGPYEDSVALFGTIAANAAAHRTLSPSQSQSYWYGQGFEWWRADPSAALALSWKKIVLAWSHQEIRNNLAFDYMRREWAPALKVTFIGFWLAGPLSLLGMVTRWRRSLFDRFLILSIGMYFTSFIAFFVADRYRLPMIPLLLIYAVEGADALGALRLREARRMALPALAGLAAATLFVNIDWYQTVTPATWAQDEWSAGLRYMALGRMTYAERQMQIALRDDPRNAEIWSSLGESEYYQGQFSKAAVAFATAARIAPGNAPNLYNLALCDEAMHDDRDARALLREAMVVDPAYEAARTELAGLSVPPSHVVGPFLPKREE